MNAPSGESSGEQTPSRSGWRSIITIVVAAAILISLGLGTDFILYDQTSVPSGVSPNKSSNDLWLRYVWYFGQYSKDDFANMVKRLQDHQITYAYFHVRDVTPDGTLKYRHPEEAKRLNNQLHETVSGCKSIAWVYVSSNKVSVADPAVRNKLVATAKELTESFGFDGVQWDYEFAPDGDPALPLLLTDTKAALPNYFVGAAVPMWYPNTLWGWNDTYIRQIAAVSDQMAVMCYDSFFYMPRAYAWLIEQQCHHFLADCANTKCKAIFGLPSYDTGDGTLGHISNSENLQLGLKAIREGLTGIDLSHLDGAAIFADYTTTPDEWQQFDAMWLNQK